MDYKTGDFVMLKNIENFKSKRPLHPDLNVFEISEILPDGFRLKYIDVNVSKDDVLPIPIDGAADRWIYYDPDIAAATILSGDSIPCHSKDYTYYFDAFARSYTEKDKSYQEIVRERDFQFVHDIQHYFDDESGSHGLKINDFKH